MSIFGKGSWYNPAGFLGAAGDLKRYAGSKTGSVLSGRAILQGGPKEQNMESARTFDVFGSPATAGTKQQSTARVGAALYGAAMAAGAAGAGSAVGGSTGGAGAGSGVGWGGTTSAASAPSATAGSANPLVTNMGYAGNSVGAGAPASSSPAWQRYARMGNSASRGMQQRPQPAPMQAQPPMLDPYGLQASGLPLDAWQDPRLQIMQAMLEQQQGVANG